MLTCLINLIPFFKKVNGYFLSAKMGIWSTHYEKGAITLIKIRNPKQYQNPNVLNSKQKRIGTEVFCFGHWYFDHLNLFRVSTCPQCLCVDSRSYLEANVMVTVIYSIAKYFAWQAGIRISDFPVDHVKITSV